MEGEIEIYSTSHEFPKQDFETLSSSIVGRTEEEGGGEGGLTRKLPSRLDSSGGITLKYFPRGGKGRNTHDGSTNKIYYTRGRIYSAHDRWRILSLPFEHNSTSIKLGRRDLVSSSFQRKKNGCKSLLLRFRSSGSSLNWQISSRSRPVYIRELWGRALCTWVGGNSVEKNDFSSVGRPTECKPDGFRSPFSSLFTFAAEKFLPPPPPSQFFTNFHLSLLLWIMRTLNLSFTFDIAKIVFLVYSIVKFTIIFNYYEHFEIIWLFEGWSRMIFCIWIIIQMI